MARALACWALGAAVCTAVAGSAGLRVTERRAGRWFLPGGRGQDPAAASAPVGRRAVLVLGHADTGTTAGAANLARVRAALAVARPGDVLVCSGGAVAGPVPEARLLADAAREHGWQGDVRVEDTSGSTWENIERSEPLLEDAARIVIVSEPVHAAKARRFLARRRPDLAARLARATRPDGTDPLPSAGTWGALTGLIDLALAERVPGWAQGSAQGLEGLRRLLASWG